MADDLIHCPSCGFQLRLPTELYGSAVECPQCQAHFTAPTPAASRDGVRPPPGREYDATGHDRDLLVEAPPDERAAAAVKVPAFILIVLSGITLLISVYGALTVENGVAAAHAFVQEMAADPAQTPQGRAFLLQVDDRITPNMLVASNLTMAGISLITVLGGIQMVRLRTYWLAIFGVIFAMNPINCPCCMAQFPIAIWALVVLLRSNVRDAFR